MVELADTLDSSSSDRNIVQVRPLLYAFVKIISLLWKHTQVAEEDCLENS